jgi:hypothetical protein
LRDGANLCGVGEAARGTPDRGEVPAGSIGRGTGTTEAGGGVPEGWGTTIGAPGFDVIKGVSMRAVRRGDSITEAEETIDDCPVTGYGVAGLFPQPRRL